MVVVCKNMNASDVQKLVPSLALSGCFNKTTANGTNTGIRNSGKCVQLKGNFLNPKKYSKEAISSSDEGCIGEKDLCTKITKVTSKSETPSKKVGWVPKSKRGKLGKDRDCSIEDVTCTLLEKVRWYLKQHYRDPSNSKTKLPANKLISGLNKLTTTPRPRNIQVQTKLITKNPYVPVDFILIVRIQKS